MYNIYLRNGKYLITCLNLFSNFLYKSSVFIFIFHIVIKRNLSEPSWAIQIRHHHPSKRVIPTVGEFLELFNGGRSDLSCRETKGVARSKTSFLQFLFFTFNQNKQLGKVLHLNFLLNTQVS